MSLTVIDWWALALVVFIGLPHGAFDAAISLSMVPSAKEIIRLAGILICYLLLAIIVILVWYQLPEFSLLVFLIISIIHFGLADYSASPTRIKWAHVIAHGGIVAIWLPVIHKAEVEELFAILTNGPTPFLWDIITILLVFWIGGALLHLYQTLRSKKHYLVGIELIGLIILARLNSQRLPNKFLLIIMEVNDLNTLVLSDDNNYYRYLNLILTFYLLTRGYLKFSFY